MNTTIKNHRCIKLKLFYDEYELDCGDGYYPLTYNENNNMRAVYEMFYLDNNSCWTQQNTHFNSDIRGLDGDEGRKLLDILNNESKLIQINNQTVKNQTSVKLCINSLKEAGAYESAIRGTPINELTKPMFVFMVIEMMVSCEMKPLADELVSYVGCYAKADKIIQGIIINNTSTKQLYPK